MPEITEFAIRGLYGYRDITIPIRDNKIVLVGVNGLGKTTIINLLYFFLSRQWYQLFE
jgi:ABC-type cobalamin/Fe3+-siderophores transport system ATPase subunit